MLLTQKGNQTTEDLVLEALGSGGMAGSILLSTVKKKLPFLPKETFYRVLRSLLEREIINKHNAIYELNLHWLERLYRFSKKHIETGEATDSDNILSFKEGDQIIYKFKDPNRMGIYWAHTYDLLFHRHDPKSPILIYHPHEWLVHTRPHAESLFLNRFEDDKKVVHFAIGGKTELDKDFKKTWESMFRQIGIGISYGQKRAEYINVLGDYVFKIMLSDRFNKDLELFFKTHQKITPENKTELEKLCTRKDSVKMTLIRSSKEAALWRARFKKHFFGPKL